MAFYYTGWLKSDGFDEPYTINNNTTPLKFKEKQ